MPTTTRTMYAKGRARREEILAAALDAYSSSGAQGPSLRTIAAAVGLTEAGVLHYFGSKDELLVAVLAARDREDVAEFELGSVESFWSIIDHATRTPGLVQLLVDMTAASASPDHPAHDFMAARTSALLRVIGEVTGMHEPWKARVLLASAEGLQTQWLRDPDVDIVGDLKRLLRTLQS